MERHFLAGLLHLNEFFGIVMQEEQYINIALHAWDHIGNKRFRTYVYKTKIKDCKVDLPCNVETIEAVLRQGEDHISTTGIDSWTVNMQNSNIEQYIEGYKKSGNFAYNRGGYIDYQQEGNTLFFKQDYGSIVILYKGTLVGEDGLPTLNFKEVDAIAKYCAFVQTQRDAMTTKDAASFQMAALLKQQWQFAVEDARTPIYLNQNDVDQILDVQGSWDRKRFGLSFKMLR